MLDDLEELLSRLTDAQKQLVLLSAKTKAFPDNNTLKKIATLALNISAVEAVITDAQAVNQRISETPKPTIEQLELQPRSAGVLFVRSYTLAGPTRVASNKNQCRRSDSSM